MIIILQDNVPPDKIEYLCKKIIELGCSPHIVRGQQRSSISIIGRTEQLNPRDFESFEGVEQVMRVSRPFKQAAIHPNIQPTTIDFGNAVRIAPESLTVAAGPCAVESEEQALRIAWAVKKAGVRFYRAGAYKPRSSPYSFQGMGVEGLKILTKVKAQTGLLIVTEVMDVSQLDLVSQCADIIQVGARNMQNFTLLKELGTISRPILLKRGPAATIEEWLMSAEYIMAGGNHQVILCERGIRSFDNQFARNTLDLNAVPILRSLTHLPIYVDPSHGTGHRHLVMPMAKAAVAAGADGIIVEVHDRPKEACSDGPQALLPEDLSALMAHFTKMAPLFGKNLALASE